MTSSRTRIPSSHCSYLSLSAISSPISTTEREIHSDLRFAPPRGRQAGAGGTWEPNTITIEQPDRHPAMTTYDAEPVPIGPYPGISHRNSLSPPRDLSQTSPATSPAHGTTRSSFTAVHDYYDRVRPTATVKRYERSAKLEPPFIDAIVPPLTTSFADG